MMAQGIAHSYTIMIAGHVCTISRIRLASPTSSGGMGCSGGVKHSVCSDVCPPQPSLVPTPHRRPRCRPLNYLSATTTRSANSTLRCPTTIANRAYGKTWRGIGLWARRRRKRGTCSRVRLTVSTVAESSCSPRRPEALPPLAL